MLLASIAERGADAVGCAWFDDGGVAQVHKHPGGARAFLDHLHVPADQQALVLHVREFTKGRPSLMANNHPIRHGRIVGVHNGQIANDEDVFSELARNRAEPGMTVDSEAIFAALDAHDLHADALGLLRGSLACAWLDEDDPGVIHLARGHGRPLWIGQAIDADAIVWTSTLEALEIVEEFLAEPLHKRPVRPGSIISIRDGLIIGHTHFTPDHTASWLANPIASPHEKLACLEALEARTA